MIHPVSAYVSPNTIPVVKRIQAIPGGKKGIRVADRVDLVKQSLHNLRGNQPTYFEVSLEQRDGKYLKHVH